MCVCRTETESFRAQLRRRGAGLGATSERFNRVVWGASLCVCSILGRTSTTGGGQFRMSMAQVSRFRKTVEISRVSRVVPGNAAVCRRMCERRLGNPRECDHIVSEDSASCSKLRLCPRWARSSRSPAPKPRWAPGFGTRCLCQRGVLSSGQPQSLGGWSYQCLCVSHTAETCRRREERWDGGQALGAAVRS